MSLGRCTRVTLNSDSTGSFYTGDIVTGTVILELEKDQKIECINLEVLGVCKAMWTRSAPTIPYIKIYSEKKKVLFIRIENIFKNFIDGKKLKAGIYSHPFHFALPQDLPSTFKTSIASVNYCIKIKSQPSCKIRKVVPFNVLGKVNLNHLDDMLGSSIYEFSRTFISDTTVKVCVKTYKSIAPRQFLPIKFLIYNENKIKIRKAKVRLIQKLHYTVSSGYADETKEICRAEYKTFSDSATQVCDINIDVPQIVPSTIYMIEPMIEISYMLKVEIVFVFHSNIQETIPVTMASFPVIHDDLSV